MAWGTGNSALAAAPADDDHALVAAIRDGDDRAFEALYERYRRRIAAYAANMLKDHGRAEDVTQEVFVSALRRMRETDRPIAFKPWIYEIARNACIDQFRRNRHAEVPLDGEEGLVRLAAPGPSPDAAAAAKQDLEDLCGAFGGLSDTHHEILLLRELEGLSYQRDRRAAEHEPPGGREHAVPGPQPARAGVRRAHDRRPLRARAAA